MKNQITVLLALVAIMLAGCNSNNKSSEIANYAYQEEKVELNKMLTEKLGSWIKEETICYGLVISIDEKGTPLFGKVIKAKVVKIKNNEIKMKALENVTLVEGGGCSKMGISKGEIWIEKDGDLFKTKEEALAYLKKNKLIKIKNTKAKV